MTATARAAETTTTAAAITATETRSAAVDADAVARDVGLLVARLTVGLLMAGHGAQKVFGWFGGSSLDETAAGFARFGYTPGRFMALLAGFSELAGGLFLALGLLTPLAAAALIGVLFNAVLGVHWSNGLYGQGGYELPLIFGGLAVGLAFAGPGRLALDRGLRWGGGGLAPGLFAVGLGVLGGLVVLVTKG